MASLTANRREFLKLYLNIGEKEEKSPKVDQIYKMATHFGVKTKYLTKSKLSDFTGSKPHQGVVMKSSKLDYISVRGFPEIFEALDKNNEQKGQFYLFLDGITDPQNFGSILRSAMFLGVDGIIVNQKDACGLTPAVSKVSSGALEFMPLFSIKFVKNFLEDSKKLGFKIISTNIDDEGDETQEKDEGCPIIAVNDLKINRDDNIILIFGSEGQGVSKTVSMMADHRVFIPPKLDSSLTGQFPFTMIDSLNVGVSAALMLYHMK
jgi:predicted rRNA methylase